jgi:hypothetical protein
MTTYVIVRNVYPYPSAGKSVNSYPEIVPFTFAGNLLTKPLVITIEKMKHKLRKGAINLNKYLA